MSLCIWPTSFEAPVDALFLDAPINYMYIARGGEGRLTDPNLNPSELPAAYHRLPYGASMYVMSF